jgi:predicted RNA-binding protein with PUA-like domain
LAKKKKPQPARWLFKEEPDHYSFDDLVRDSETVWDGITNNLARQNLRKVQKGDRILYYHTGNEKAIVGEMEAVTDPYPDPESDDPKAVVVRVRAGRRWPRPLTLGRIKKEAQLQDWELVRFSRLSVVPVSAVQWEKIVSLSQEA